MAWQAGRFVVVVVRRLVKNILRFPHRNKSMFPETTFSAAAPRLTFHSGFSSPGIFGLRKIKGFPPPRFHRRRKSEQKLMGNGSISKGGFHSGNFFLMFRPLERDPLTSQIYIYGDRLSLILIFSPVFTLFQTHFHSLLFLSSLKRNSARGPFQPKYFPTHQTQTAFGAEGVPAHGSRRKCGGTGGYGGRIAGSTKK